MLFLERQEKKGFALGNLGMVDPVTAKIIITALITAAEMGYSYYAAQKQIREQARIAQELADAELYPIAYQMNQQVPEVSISEWMNQLRMTIGKGSGISSVTTGNGNNTGGEITKPSYTWLYYLIPIVFVLLGMGGKK